MIPSGARCGTHPEIAAVDLCKRCGRFLCGECIELVGEDAYCEPCAQRVEAPASALAKAAMIVAGVAWLLFGAFSFALRAPLFLVLLVLVPGPSALAATVMGMVEWRRIKRGETSARGKRWVVVALVVATPLFLLMTAMVAYGLFAFQ